MLPGSAFWIMGDSPKRDAGSAVGCGGMNFQRDRFFFLIVTTFVKEKFRIPYENELVFFFGMICLAQANHQKDRG